MWGREVSLNFVRTDFTGAIVKKTTYLRKRTKGPSN